jgi:hypothetical protein
MSMVGNPRHCVQDLCAVEAPSSGTTVLVGQSYFDAADRYTTHRGAQVCWSSDTDVYGA